MENKLIELWFSNKQAEVYLKLLKLWSEKASTIASETNIKRASIYAILEELLSMWVITYTLEWKIKYFKALNPQKIIKLIESKKQKALNILPDLENMMNFWNINKPKVTYFRWVEWVKNIYDDTLNCKYKTVYQIIKVKEHLHFLWKKYIQNYIDNRVKRWISAYSIHPLVNDFHNDIYAETSEKYKRTCRYVDENMFSASMIMIYDNKVAVMSTKKEDFGFLIESHEFSKSMKVFFDIMWKTWLKKPLN